MAAGEPGVILKAPARKPCHENLICARQRVQTGHINCPIERPLGGWALEDYPAGVTDTGVRKQVREPDYPGWLIAHAGLATVEAGQRALLDPTEPWRVAPYARWTPDRLPGARVSDGRRSLRVAASSLTKLPVPWSPSGHRWTGSGAPRLRRSRSDPGLWKALTGSRCPRGSWAASEPSGRSVPSGGSGLWTAGGALTQVRAPRGRMNRGRRSEGPTQWAGG